MNWPDHPVYLIKKQVVEFSQEVILKREKIICSFLKLPILLAVLFFHGFQIFKWIIYVLNVKQ